MTTVKIFLGECEVEYHGRAESHLPTGERLVLVRPNVVTVHALDDKVNPTNYMMDAKITIDRASGTINATRNSPDENLHITFSRIDKVIEYNGSDKANLDLTGTEDELQADLFSNPHKISDSFSPKEREHDTGAGPVDLYGTINNTPTCVEVKKHANVSAVGQLARYVKAKGQNHQGILASHTITQDAQDTLNQYDNLEWKQV